MTVTCSPSPPLKLTTRELGLDKPLPRRFLIYAEDTLTLNFGKSFFFRGQDVKSVIAQRIWPTLQPPDRGALPLLLREYPDEDRPERPVMFGQ